MTTCNKCQELKNALAALYASMAHGPHARSFEVADALRAARVALDNANRDTDRNRINGYNVEFLGAQPPRAGSDY